MQDKGRKECPYLGKGATGAEALESLRMHIQGRHQKEVDYREEEARKKKMSESKQERQMINEERLKQLELEAEEVKKTMRIKAEEATGEKNIGGMLKNLNENRADRLGEALNAEKVY